MFGKSNSHKILIVCAYFLIGTICAIYLYWPAFSSWYLREDSRFFAVGFFSFYDLVNAFIEPYNSMGQYRPITKALWSFPYWLNLPLPFTYHIESFLLLLIGSAALARVFYLFFPSLLSAGMVFCLYLLFPLHQKSQYWLAAWHNTAAVTFFLLALVFRWEIKNPLHGLRNRLLSLVFLYLGLASREVVFALLPILILMDFLNLRSIKKSFDVVALTLFLGLYLFYWNEPFGAAHVKLGGENSTNLSWIFETVLSCIANSLWSNGDHVNEIPSAIDRYSAYAVFSFGFIFSLFHRGFLLGLMFCVLGLVPFLIVGNVHIEYCSFLACGMAIFLGGYVYLLQEKLKNKICWIAIPLALIAIGIFQKRSLETRKIYLDFYLTQSFMVRDFVSSLSKAAEKAPPHRLLQIVDFGEYKTLDPALVSHHFLVLGLDHLVPQRYMLFRNEDLGMLEGTNIKDIIDAGGYWSKVIGMVEHPIKLKYRAGEFIQLND